MSELVTVFYESELILRDDGDGDGRSLIGVLVPWDTATPVDSSGRFATAAGAAFESFSRGAFDKTIAEAKQGIPLYGGKHSQLGSRDTSRNAAGVLMRSENLPEGQVAEWRLFDNYEGREAREMAEAKIWTGFSVGVYEVRTAKGTLAGKPHYARQEVKLDHVAFLRNPSYADAKVLALRAEAELADPAAAIRARARMRRLSNRLR